MSKSNTYRQIKALALSICLLVCTSASRAQVLTDLQNRLAAYQKGNLHEKLYVHISKNAYLAGEIIWFKIYCVDGSNNKPLDLSKVAYVEVLDDKNAVVLQAKIAMNNGVGSGSFFVPLTASSGNFRFRAYTNWMRNFDAAYYFQENITIINTRVASSVETNKDSANYDVQFFPEGGHLVKGLSSKVAFKITAPDGLGRDGSGVIIGPQNDTLARFGTLKFGIGSFTIQPTAQTGYKTIIRVGKSVITKPLPDISASGYVMQATNQGANWDVRVQSAGDVAASDIYLIVHSGNQTEMAARGALANGETHFAISKDKLNGGISYITLFEGQKPVCERLIFNRPDRKLLISAVTDAPQYHPREKVNLDIAAHDQHNNNEAANLSVSVYRLDSLQKSDEVNIAGYLWLSADVKGYIESPDYYLDTNDDQALDNLLLSQGWTQFDWNKVIGNALKINFLPEYKGPIITGKLTSTANNEPAKNILTYLTITGTQHQLYIAKSDSTGGLLFSTKNFYGPREIVVQTNWLRDSTYRIDITNPYSEEYDQRPVTVFRFDTAMRNVLTENNINTQVQNAFRAKELKQFGDVPAESPVFYGTPTYNYKLDDYTRFPTTQEVIFEYVRLVRMTRSNGKVSFQLVGEDKNVMPDHPLTMLDSKPIFDGTKVLGIGPLKVKSLDVVTHSYIYGPEVHNGILAFSSYDGASINTELDPRAIVLDFDGLQLERKFYSPVYDSDQQRNSPVPDFRNALYWNPNVNTDVTGGKLSFYTGDKTGKFIGVIQGISSTGNAGSKYFYFEVKK